MTKGIREYTNARFLKLLPKLADLGNAGFRRAVMESTVSKFEISVASAATHYNHAFKTARATDPASVEGLGRADDKKGGRPVQNPVNVIKAKSGVVVLEGVSLAKAKEAIAASQAKGKVKLALAA